MKKFNADYFSRMLFKGRKQTSLAILLTILALACSTTLYLPKENPLISKDDLVAMKNGRTLYISKCGSCHTLFLPEKYISQDWKTEVEKMSSKVHLTDREKEEILRYVTKNDSSLFHKPNNQNQKMQ